MFLLCATSSPVTAVTAADVITNFPSSHFFATLARRLLRSTISIPPSVSVVFFSVVFFSVVFFSSALSSSGFTAKSESAFILFKRRLLARCIRHRLNFSKCPLALIPTSKKIMTPMTTEVFRPIPTESQSHQANVPPRPSSHLGCELKTVPAHIIKKSAPSVTCSKIWSILCWLYGRVLEVAKMTIKISRAPMCTCISPRDSPKTPRAAITTFRSATVISHHQTLESYIE